MAALWVTMGLLGGWVVLLTFGGGVLLRRLVALEAQERNMSGISTSLAWTGNGPALVLVADHHCLGCVERVRDFEDLATSERSLLGDTALILLQPTGSLLSAGDAIQVISDDRIFGSLFVTATPMVLLVGHGGREISRHVVGSRDTLDSLLVQFLNNSEHMEIGGK